MNKRTSEMKRRKILAFISTKTQPTAAADAVVSIYILMSLKTLFINPHDDATAYKRSLKL